MWSLSSYLNLVNKGVTVYIRKEPEVKTENYLSLDPSLIIRSIELVNDNKIQIKTDTVTWDVKNIEADPVNKTLTIDELKNYMENYSSEIFTMCIVSPRNEPPKGHLIIPIYNHNTGMSVSVYGVYLIKEGEDY